MAMHTIEEVLADMDVRKAEFLDKIADIESCVLRHLDGCKKQ